MLKGNSLEDLWVKMLDHVWECGSEIMVEEEMLECKNLAFSYTNASLLSVDKYSSHVPGNFIENIDKIYQKGGDGWNGRNYAKYIYDAHGVDQVEKVVSVLKEDPHSKSAIIFLSDGSNPKSPCVVLINFSIREMKLNMNVVFKSSDIVSKFVPDLLAISKLHKQISSRLMIGRGEVSGFILSAQLYSKDKATMKNILDDSRSNETYDLNDVIKNWDIAAHKWEVSLNDKDHYVNFEDGYNRFANHLKEILNNLDKESVKNAIDLGAGTGFIAAQTSKFLGECDVLDVSPKMLDNLGDVKGKKILSNVFDIPAEDEYYDFAVSRGVLLSHVGPGNAEKMLNEVNRVLKSGSLFYFDFITKFDDSEVRYRKTKNSFVPNDIVDLVTKVGFKVKKMFDDNEYRVASILVKKYDRS